MFCLSEFFDASSFVFISLFSNIIIILTFLCVMKFFVIIICGAKAQINSEFVAKLKINKIEIIDYFFIFSTRNSFSVEIA